MATADAPQEEGVETPKPSTEKRGAESAPKADDDPQADARARYEIIFGLLLAVFAAILALNELGGGKYGDDELRLASEKSGAYLWYQSKGIKESLAEGQRDLLRSIVDGGGMKPDQEAGMRANIEGLSKKVDRYEKEKNEILLGSAKVGEANWSQEVDGALGKVVGVKEIEAELDKLGVAGDRFDMGTLFLQLGLVFGAIGLIMKQLTMKRIFLVMVIALGLIGATFTSLAYHQVGLF
jgi:hypothetical protein